MYEAKQIAPNVASCTIVAMDASPIGMRAVLVVSARGALGGSYSVKGAVCRSNEAWR